MTDKHFVVYCDAGTAPGNPGPTGIGIHGYVYTERTSKTYSGHPTHSPTKEGYVEKVLFTRAGKDYKDTEVELIEYVDLSAPIGPHFTNQYGEITAMTRALEIALELEVKSVYLFSDSQYTIKGVTEWFKGWVKRGWINSKGEPVANRAIFEKLHAVKTELESKGVKVDIHWVKGHTGQPGNTEADSYATVGRTRILKGKVDEIYKVTPSKGYWKSEVDRHPFLHHVNLYIPVLSKAFQDKLIFTGTHGKGEDEIGMRATESSFAILELDELDPHIELLVNEVKDDVVKRRMDTDPFVRLRLTAMYNGRYDTQLKLFGADSIKPTSYKTLDYSTILTEEPIIEHSDPAFLAYELQKDLEDLVNIYDMYKSGDKHLVIKDITDHLYETTTKGKKEVTTLRATFTTSSRRLVIPVDYRTKLKDIRQAWITLLFGIGMPGRNQFKRFESLEPKVEVVTWSIGDGVFRYAVVVTISGGRGIWSNIYSNYRFTKLDEQADQPYVEYEDGQQATI